jgi:CHAT domain-containing protein
LLKVEKEHLFTQAEATEAKVKELHSPRMLHIATHGFFLKDNELPAAALRVGGFAYDQAPVPLVENPLLRSGLALAGANLRQSGDSDDGILTPAEVAQMDLRGTQLVVLSACETGVGDVLNGEGVYGLRRALVLAGAETQVASLWKVADAATKDLMVEYYQRLLKGEGRSAALRAAQRTMMMSQRAHPYYWAAFVPVGNWTPLARSH